MMNKCTGYWLDNFVRTTHVQDNLTFISMDNNLTATIIMYYMDGSDQWHTMYKTKLVIPSTQTDILPQHKLFLCGYAVLNRTVWYIINCGQYWNWTIYITHYLQNILYYSVVFDIWLTLWYSNACSSNSLLCYSTVNLTLTSVNNKWRNFCVIWLQ
jgi:hypothetical protein